MGRDRSGNPTSRSRLGQLWYKAAPGIQQKPFKVLTYPIISMMGPTHSPTYPNL